MGPRLPGILKILGIISVLLVAQHTGSITLGLAIGVALILAGELLWVRERMRSEGILQDERERLIQLKSYHTAGLTYTIIAGLVVASSLVLEEWSIIKLDSYKEGLIAGLAIAVFMVIAIASLASIYHSRTTRGYGL